MSPERQSLAEAFRPVPPVRGTKLEGILAPRRRQTVTASAPTPPVQAQPASESKGFDSTSKQPPVKASKPASPEPSKTSTTVPGATRNVGVYLPPELHDSVKEAARQQRTTYGDLLVDAFDAIDEAMLANHFSPKVQAVGSSMPRRTRRPRGTAGIQIQVRLDDLQLKWLDEKVGLLQAPSRSALVSAAYQLHVTGTL